MTVIAIKLLVHFSSRSWNAHEWLFHQCSKVSQLFNMMISILFNRNIFLIIFCGKNFFVLCPSFQSCSFNYFIGLFFEFGKNHCNAKKSSCLNWFLAKFPDPSIKATIFFFRGFVHVWVLHLFKNIFYDKETNQNNNRIWLFQNTSRWYLQQWMLLIMDNLSKLLQGFYLFCVI